MSANEHTVQMEVDMISKLIIAAAAKDVDDIGGFKLADRKNTSMCLLHRHCIYCARLRLAQNYIFGEIRLWRNCAAMCLTRPEQMFQSWTR